MPTILEAIGVEPPSQTGGYVQAPIEGVSMFYSFNDPNAPTTKQLQYFEMLGNRGIWSKGWKAITFHGRQPLQNRAKWSFDEDKWELYDVEDFSEYNNLANKHPNKLRQLVERWWAEAGKFNVLPLDDRLQERLAERAMMEKERASFTFYPCTVRVPEGSAPHVKNRSYSITAEVEIPAKGAEGPICAIGGVGSGWSLYIKDRRLVYCYNCVGERYYVRSTKEVPTGKKAKLRFEFKKTGQEKFGVGGIGRLYIDNDKVGEGEIPRTVKFIYSADESFDIGRDTGSPVTDEYKAGAQFTGTIKRVIVDLAGERPTSYHTDTIVRLADTTELRRCTIGACLCIIHLEKPEEKK